MLAQLSLAHSSIFLLFILVVPVAYYILQRMRYELHLRKIGGVRAPRVASNPLSATIWFIKAARAHRRNEFLGYFNGLFDNNDQANKNKHNHHHHQPNCVELQIRPGERYLLTRDAEHIKAVLATRFGHFGKGERFHALWQPFLGDGIFTTDGRRWSDSRALLRPMFAGNRVRDLATFERGAADLLRRLPAPGRTADIMDLLYRMTLDVTTDFLLGASCHSLENPQSEFASAFNEVQSIQMMLTMIGPFEALVPRWRYNRGIEVINRFVMPYIEQALALPPEELEKIANSADRDPTFLHSIARYTRDPKVLRDQIVAVLLAGRDTTAATLSWALFELCRYPAKVARLRREIREAVGVGPEGRAPHYADLKAMPYLRHVLSETLRLYPAVPYNLRAALEDTTLPGPTPESPPIAVARGDIVIYSTLALHRRRDLYPPTTMTTKGGGGGDGEEEEKEGEYDPGVFAPERWERWNPRPWHYVPFNGGPRICVGQNFAMTEMAYFLVRLFQKYDRLEYRGDWHAQKHEAEVVGRPSQGVKIALYEEPAEATTGKEIPELLTVV